ncbi:HAD-superfamily phosphatase [Martensiomyces pterosporus]|nr:HAD-superfamily phosphatase [Martensiomyces pterosporus]
MVQSLNLAGIRGVFSILRSPHLLMPHLAVSDIRSIPYEKLRSQGINYLVFDKDNCLTAPYANHIHPEFEAAWSHCLSVFPRSNILIVSNSAGTPDDKDCKAAHAVEKGLGVQVLQHKVKKPGCGGEILARLSGASASEVAVVGDRLATDVVLANLNGMLAIWTRDIVTEEGDNAVAARLRGMEHWAYEMLRKRSVKAPSHPSGVSH